MSKTMLFYKDLCLEIDILELQIKGVEKEYSNIYNKSLHVKPKGVNAVDYGSERVTGGLVQIPAYDAIGKLDNLIDRLNEMKQELLAKKKLKEEVEEELKKFEGLPYKVNYMRIVEGKKLTEIADELDYSYDYIREVASKNNPLKTHKKVANS